MAEYRHGDYAHDFSRLHLQARVVPPGHQTRSFLARPRPPPAQRAQHCPQGHETLKHPLGQPKNDPQDM